MRVWTLVHGNGESLRLVRKEMTPSVFLFRKLAATWINKRMKKTGGGKTSLESAGGV